jgi:hypothetical protein
MSNSTATNAPNSTRFSQENNSFLCSAEQSRPSDARARIQETHVKRNARIRPRTGANIARSQNRLVVGRSTSHLTPASPRASTHAAMCIRHITEVLLHPPKAGTDRSSPHTVANAPSWRVCVRRWPHLGDSTVWGSNPRTIRSGCAVVTSREFGKVSLGLDCGQRRPRRRC